MLFSGWGLQRIGDTISSDRDRDHDLVGEVNDTKIDNLLWRSWCNVASFLVNKHENSTKVTFVKSCYFK